MPGKKQTGAEEGGGGGEMGVGGWKGGGKRWRKDYIVPRTGHSVYELPQSLSRFQRLSPSFFFLAVSVVFGERRRLTSPPIRAHTLSPSLSLFSFYVRSNVNIFPLFSVCYLPSLSWSRRPNEKAICGRYGSATPNAKAALTLSQVLLRLRQSHPPYTFMKRFTSYKRWAAHLYYLAVQAAGHSVASLIPLTVQFCRTNWTQSPCSLLKERRKKIAPAATGDQYGLH